MKISFLKTTALVLACLTLVVSFNWSVNAHYCGSDLINYAFIGEAEGCGMDEFDEVCESSADKNGVLDKTCCSNRDLVFDGVDQVRKISSNILANTNFILLSTSMEGKDLPNFNKEGIQEWPNPPPIKAEDFQVLYQVYII